MFRRISGGWLVAAAVVLAVMLPIGAFAAGSLVEISSSNGVKARVTAANQLYTAEATPSQFRRGAASSSYGACVLVMAPVDGKALIVRSAAYNVYVNPTPNSGNWVGMYTGEGGCHTPVDSYNPQSLGRSQVVFEPGLAIPDGHGLYVKTQNDVQAEVYAHGYQVAASAVPTPPDGLVGSSKLPRHTQQD